MESIKLTKGQACRFMLAHQKLWPPRTLRGKEDILKFISKVGCIQFDPLDVVGRNSELVLQARVSGFDPQMLNELLYTDRELVDGFDKMMSIYSVADWPHFARCREAALHSICQTSKPISDIVPEVRRSIEEQGPLSSIDLNYDDAVDWPWGPTRLAKAALESMYSWGELVIHHKERTRKVYDLAARHIPDEILSASDPHTTDEQYFDWRVYRRIGSIGLIWNRSGDAWLGIPELNSSQRSQAFARLLDQGDIVEMDVEGMSYPLYMRSADKPTLHEVLSSTSAQPGAAVIAPLDNLIWDRRLIGELFDFDYRWEVYKPVAERRYGYYVLPVLHGDSFVARFEPGFERKTRTLIIKNWWWEPEVEESTDMHDDLASCFREFLSYLHADRIQIEKTAVERPNLDWLSQVSASGIS